MNNYKKYFQIVWKVLILISISIGIFFLLFDTNSSNEIKFETINPTRMTIKQEISATGQILPRVKVKIKSQANGLIEDILITPGQWVKRGDLLARVRLRADPLEINISQNRINKALLQNERAHLELKRQTSLYERNIISDAEYQNTKLKYKVTLSDLEQAKRDLELRIKGTSGKFKTTSTLIYAPIDGMVLENFVELGDFVIKANDLSEGTTTFTIADMHNLIFKGDVGEIDAGKLYIDMPMTVAVGALPEDMFSAVLEFISPEVKKTKEGRNVIEIRAAIKTKKDKTLRAGYSATSHIVLTQHDDVLTIPDETLLFDGVNPFLQVLLESGEIVNRKLKTGLSDGLNTEVVSGLDDNDNIIISQPMGKLQ